MGVRLRGSTTNTRIRGNTLFIDSLRVRFHWDAPRSTRGRKRTRDAFVRGMFSAGMLAG